jgi:hypothetical protein
MTRTTAVMPELCQQCVSKSGSRCRSFGRGCARAWRAVGVVARAQDRPRVGLMPARVVTSARNHAAIRALGRALFLDRAIAAEVGVDHKTVARAQNQTGHKTAAFTLIAYSERRSRGDCSVTKRNAPPHSWLPGPSQAVALFFLGSRAPNREPMRLWGGSAIERNLSDGLTCRVVEPKD